MKKDKIVEVLESQSEKDFELIIGDKGGEILSADIPVRWCVNPDFLKKMDEAGVVDPHVLISVVSMISRNDKEFRKLVPLTEMMTYLSLNKAGKFKIMAWIVDGNVSRQTLSLLFMTKKEGNFITTIYTDFYGEIVNEFGIEFGLILTQIGKIYWDMNNINCAITSETIDVPKNAFANEPPPWLKWYVNLWHESKPRDQCAFRRRAILGFTLKWIPFAFFAFFKIFFQFIYGMFMILCGFTRSVNWKLLIHPYDTDWWNAFNVIGDKGKQQYIFGKNYTLGFMLIPMNLIFIFIVIMISIGDPKIAISILIFQFILLGALDIDTFYRTPGYFLARDWKGFFLVKEISKVYNSVDNFITRKGLGPALFFIVLGILGVLGLFVLYWTIKVIIAILSLLPLVPLIIVILGSIIIPYLSLFIIDRMYIKSDQNDYMNAQELLCPYDHENLEAKVQSVPIKKRTIRLVYQDLKHSVCKPMQW